MMKKCLIRLAACAAAAACVLSFAACSSNGKTASSAVSSSQATGLPASSAAESSQAAPSSEAGVSSETTASSEAAGGKTADGKYATVEDFVNSASMKKQLESMKSSLSGDGLTLDITAEGNKLIYTFTYTESLAEDELETMTAAMETALDQMSGTFEDVASSLRDVVDVESPAVVVAYVTADGAGLCSREFTPAE